MKKKLYRSSDNKLIAGVCGGFGEFTTIDANIIRIALTLICMFTGVLPMALVYGAAVLLIPMKPIKASEAEIDVTER